MALRCMKAVPERRCWILTLLLSSRERRRDGWLQTEAREIQVRTKAGGFSQAGTYPLGETFKESRGFWRFQIKPSCISKRNVAQAAHQAFWGDSVAGDQQEGFLQGVTLIFPLVLASG